MSSPSRKYTSERRKLQAEQTQRQIVASARKLFAEKGYVRTTIADIARDAGVAIQTVYAGLGSKRAILAALQDVLDEEAGTGELHSKTAVAEDAHEILRLVAHFRRRMYERASDIIAVAREAAPADPDVMAALEEGKHRSRSGAGRVAKRLADGSSLRADVTEEMAADVLVAIADDVYVRLVDDLGWSPDEYERWLASALERLLLAQPHG